MVSSAPNNCFSALKLPSPSTSIVATIFPEAENVPDGYLKRKLLASAPSAVPALLATQALVNAS